VDCEDIIVTGLELLSRATGWTIWNSIRIGGNSFLDRLWRQESLFSNLKSTEKKVNWIGHPWLRKTSAATGQPQGKEKIL